ncbi:phosphotransferase [Dactylosporangium sp. NPDC051485]|uniref:phosphotransferase n=1 Tax=Dactylosporangium sp. NPDC051485 TaxID=3154846 RepID=UPI00341ABD1E
MTLVPRFRPGASRRPFVDRENAIGAFDEMLVGRDSAARVLNVTGVGGIGKSRLLAELRKRVPEGWPTALLDLQVPAQREQQDALAVLREQFGQQQVKFHRFDIAYAVLWQRLHPKLSLNKEGSRIVENSEVLASLLDNATGLPVFGTAARLLDAGARSVRRWHHIRANETLQELDNLQLPQLMDAVTFLFAADIKETAERTPLLFVDAYEALVGGAARAGRTASMDAWLRDLIAQFDTGLVVVASREAVNWHNYDRAWADLIRTLPVEGLPMEARLQLLRAMGVTDSDLAKSIAMGSAGLPFYLHLAHDTGTATGSVVSPEAILERFLQHVDPNDVRTIELLSATRIFDPEIFQAVTTAYGLPSHNLAWESLTSYSFVQPAGVVGLRLHLLMATTICQRLSSESLRALHRLLHTVWRGRAAAAGDPAAAAVALREAAFHGIRGGDLEPVTLLGYIDRVRSAAAATGVDGMVADLEEFLAEQPSPQLQYLATYLHVDALLMRGDSQGALELTVDVPVEPPSDEVRARLAVAAGHARRILGQTADALRRYEVVWQEYDGPTRLDAGLWAADLHMAQGRFVRAIEAAEEIDRLLPTDRHEGRGDLWRLVHLGYRFMYDYEASREYLERARERYLAGGSVVGLADIQTNTAELLALTDPTAAVQAAHEAIDRQREIGANHELGKAYSALGLAHTVLGELDAAEYALTEAIAAFERAAYRSGRARAELYRAGWLVRSQRLDEAMAAVRWAVSEFEDAEVYPTMAIVGARLAERIGRPEPALAAAAEKARRLLQLPPGVADLDRRIGDVLSRLLADGLSERYQAALEHTERAAGFYNHNVRVGEDLVRIPMPDTATMDLTVWPEYLILAAVGRHLSSVPRLRAASVDPRFQIHEYIEGDVVDTIAPRGVRVPDGTIEQVADFFAALARVPVAELPPTPGGWPADGDCRGFASRLSAVTAAVHRRYSPEHGGMWQRLGFPEEPLASIDWSAMTSRPFQLVHADVHRKNMIRTSAGKLVIIDWELALWGDPVYDLASHLHKMGYQPGEEELIRGAWFARQPPEVRRGWEDDLWRYLRHERVKSAVVDSVRYSEILRDPTTSPERARALIDNFTMKVARAREVWGDSRPADPAEISAALRGS